MKKFLMLLFLFISHQALAVDFYVKNGGNDLAAGTSDATAWATLGKVNSYALNPGDRILFKCGDTWRITTGDGYLFCKSGNVGENIVYQSYGAGAKPSFMGSKQENAEGDWINVGTNLWRNSDATFITEVGNIIFNKGGSCAVRVKTLAAVNDQGDFFYDSASDCITLYSVENPAIYYSDIECALKIMPAIVSIGDKDYITIDGLDIRYCARHGISASNGASHITIRNCDISFVGGALSTSDVRLGNGIEFYNTASDILIENNYIVQVYDEGITNQTFGSTINPSNIVVRYNILDKCDCALSLIYSSGAAGSLGKIYFDNNTCVESGYGWSNQQKADIGWGNREGFDVIIQFTSTSFTTSDLYIRNNIFSGARRQAIRGTTTPQDLVATAFVWDNNLYNITSIAYCGNSTYTFDQWKAYSGDDVHSISGSPSFTSGSDFHLLSSSPAIDAGINFGHSDDYDGNPIVGNPDIGAFEYQGSMVEPAIPVYQSSAVENAAPSRIDITYNLTLTNVIPATSAFTVMVNSAARTVSSVAISGSKVLLTLASPVANGDAVTVAYTKPAANPIQTAAGGQAASFTAKSVTNNVVPVAPDYVSSSVENATPSRIDMTYNLTLANIIPATSAFTIMVNSAARTVSSVTISGTKVQLTLASPVTNGDAVTVAYTKPAANPIQTAAGGQAASFTAKSVTNNVGPVAPAYVSSAVENATPSRIDLTYDMILANVIPTTSAFIVTVNSAAKSVSSVIISGTKVMLTLASPVVNSDQVTLAYTKPSTNPLQTAAGGQAASFTAKSVTNNVSPVDPVLASSAVENATPGRIDLTYNLTLANIVPTSSAFTVKVNAASRTVSSVAISGTKVLLTLASPVANADAVTVAYSKPSTNPIQTSAGGQAASFTARSVTNNVGPVAPDYVSSAVENATPSRVDMTYNLTLANIIPATSAFAVTVNSAPRSVSSVAISGTKVLLTLASPVANADAVTVAYSKPSTNPIQTSAGGQAAPFTAKSVTNNVGPVAPDYVSSAVENATPSRVDMTYNLTLANIIPATSAFAVTVNSAAKSVSSVAISGTKVLLTLASPVANGDAVTVAYTKPATNPIQTAAGGQAASFTAKSVTNNVSPVAPAYVSSAVENATPSRIDLTYNLTLASIVPATSAFVVTVNSAAKSVNSVAISGTKVLLTLASPVVNGDAVTVAYTKPAANPIQTAAGGQATSITAKSVTNNVENKSPEVSLSSPTKSASYVAPATITIEAAASDEDGTIIKVEFYNGSTKLGERTASPFSYTWKDVVEGTYLVTAVATDNKNSKTTSAAVTVVVENSATAINQLPIVNITSPGNKEKYKKNDKIVIEAVASDPDGIITKVEFKSGSTIIAEITTAPYSYTLEAADTGAYQITAIATDNLGAKGTSSNVEFIVEPYYDANSEIINLYPNPNFGQFTIDFLMPIEAESYTVTIVNLLGKAVYKNWITRDESVKQIDLSHLDRGTYVLIIASDKIVTTKKFIIS